MLRLADFSMRVAQVEVKSLMERYDFHSPPLHAEAQKSLVKDGFLQFTIFIDFYFTFVANNKNHDLVRA